MPADLSDRSGVIVEPDSNSTWADGRSGQAAHARTFLQPTLSDGDNLWCGHLFLSRCVIKRHPLNPVHDRMIHFPSIPWAALTEIAFFRKLRNCWEKKKTSHAGFLFCFFHIFKFALSAYTLWLRCACDIQTVGYWLIYIRLNATCVQKRPFETQKSRMWPLSNNCDGYIYIIVL